MVTIDLNRVPYLYLPSTFTFVLSEKFTPSFATEYLVLSPKGGSSVFKFIHSTGPEFDPNTKWVYKNENDCELHIENDKVMTERAAEQYLKAKLHNS